MVSSSSWLQAQADEAIQEVVRGVHDGMTGQPANKVLAELVKRMKKIGVNPDMTNLRKVAKAIEEGALRG